MTEIEQMRQSLEEASSMAIRPFSIPYSQAGVDDLHERLQRTRWPDQIPNCEWTYGFDLEFLRSICEYWQAGFDWKAQVERLAALPHYEFTAGDSDIHFIHQRGKGSHSIPLVLTHGWPGSFLEMLRILPLLTDPEAHGADPADSFDVIVPSLPGYAYSRPPAVPGVNVFRIAELWIDLMREIGYDRFAAQGGDWGAGVTTILGLRHADRILGIHLNYIPGSFRPHLAEGTQLSPAEQQFLEDADKWREESGAYSHLQRTHPQTLAYGLNDSPVALAAWILEKFRDWADCDGDVYRRFTRDELLTNVTLYWMTQTIASSCRLYFEGRKAPVHFGPGDFVQVPVGIARFPKEAPFPPRAWIERGYNVRHWTEMSRGGHFAAAEEPELLAEDIRAFFRRLR